MDGAEVERVEVCRQKVENNLKLKDTEAALVTPSSLFFCDYKVVLCVHRLRRVDTGLRNTDITGAHGLVIHGFLLFIYLILCAFGTDLKGFWRASSPHSLRTPTSDA